MKLYFRSIKKITANDAIVRITPSIPSMYDAFVEMFTVDMPATVNTAMLFIECNAVETSRPLVYQARKANINPLTKTSIKPNVLYP